MRLVILGGSGASTPELMDAIVEWPGGVARRPPLEIVLHGRSAGKLEVVAAACRQRLGEAAADITVLADTDLDRVLDGADVVLIQMRVGGLDARVHDETFPRTFGLPGEETMGPGGFANAVRTVPALATAWDSIAARAPTAFVINLTNPSGIVTQAAVHHGGFRVVSVCDAPVTFVDAIARAVGRTPADVRARYAGMNHVGFWIPDDPADLVTALPASTGIDPDDVAALGALPTSYVRFYLHPDRQLEAQRAAQEGRAQVLQRIEAEMLQQYADGLDASMQVRRGALWYRVSVVPVIDGILHGAPEPIVLGLPNQGVVPWAPAEAIVELPTRISAGGGLERSPSVSVPSLAAGLLARHALFETLTADALAGTSRDTDIADRRPALMRALAANPMVPTIEVAARIVDAGLTPAAT